MARPLDWTRDGPVWPHHEASRFVALPGLRWHVQQIAAPPGAPTVLLLHGTGASTHSWRGVMMALAGRLGLVAVDLPGHAFTGAPADPDRLGLPGMAAALAELLHELRCAPELVVGHSAGAAVGAQLCLDGALQPAALVSVNGALLPLSGLAGSFFSPVARLLARSTLVPRLFSWRASDPVVCRRLLEGTGSRIDAAGAAFYRRLLEDPGHVGGALGMMARWDLQTFARELPRLTVPLHLLVAERDLTLPRDQARQLHERLPRASLVRLPGLGHLAHEEDPAQVAHYVERLTKPIVKSS
ncbi:MAG: alpha/beta fold hydrolase [Piscinibacter sp.]|uniref:alpha/beta fold hydrolase BchO n=1 Tax=Piscinibacter sp. TaxID=1903157 RepID=UPI00258317C6|nr:alpha/beta fold hydrolase BchO [Piscinibacter sp.]MCW5662520.1 alpha/beta fold hydrolase [Piscinibacter sp.]